MVDYTITGEFNPSYNCIGWTENSGWPRVIWPPSSFPHADPGDVMDRFFAELGMQRVAAEPDVEFKGTVISLYANATGPTHAARRDRGFPEWWESKLGLTVRVMHRLAELEGGMYGDVVGFYKRSDP